LPFGIAQHKCVSLKRVYQVPVCCQTPNPKGERWARKNFEMPFSFITGIMYGSGAVFENDQHPDPNFLLDIQTLSLPVEVGNVESF
jgi:hypothetical protein